MGQGSFNVVVVDGRPPPLLDDNLIFMALQHSSYDDGVV